MTPLTSRHQIARESQQTPLQETGQKNWVSSDDSACPYGPRQGKGSRKKVHSNSVQDRPDGKLSGLRRSKPHPAGEGKTDHDRRIGDGLTAFGKKTLAVCIPRGVACGRTFACKAGAAGGGVCAKSVSDGRMNLHSTGDSPRFTSGTNLLSRRMNRQPHLLGHALDNPILRRVVWRRVVGPETTAPYGRHASLGRCL